MRQCQKCQKPSEHPFGTFGTPSLSVFAEITPLLWKRRGECPGAVPVLACHDEVVVECEAERAADAKAWLEGAMIEGMDAVMNSMGKAPVPIEVEARIFRSWGERGSLRV